ncbi:MAG: hypothetical protein V1870_01050 [Candidatus Aenigmatarchaeota archaeon]
MLEIAIIVAFIGALTAGILDLRSSEFPDDIPYFMIALGLFIWFIYALTTGDAQPLILSIVLGALFSVIGYISYRLGAWGDGDAAILAAIVFVIPSVLFLMDFIMNMLIVSIVYIVLYSLVIGIGKETVRKNFKKDVRCNKYFLLGYLVFLVIILIVGYLISPALLLYLFLLWLLGLLMIFFIVYGKNIEKSLFRKRIPIDLLREGDVLASSKQLRGLTKYEVEELKKHHKFVDIKEGVRVTIVFAIAIAITALFGNLMFMILV